MGTASSATGVISMVLLTAVVVLGIGVNRRVRLAGLPRFASLSVHRFTSLLAVCFLALHIVTAVAAPYGGIGPAAAFIPFAAGYESAWLGLGAVASDLIIALIVTSLVRRRIGRRTWRAVHWLAYACWLTALAHSIGIGSGMRTGHLLDLAIACAFAVLGASGWRLAGLLRSVPSARRAGADSPGGGGLQGRQVAAITDAGADSRGAEKSLRVDPIACTGHGLCADLLPELITLDPWGYPLVADQPVPARLARRARRTVTDCPALALRLGVIAVRESARPDR